MRRTHLVRRLALVALAVAGSALFGGLTIAPRAEAQATPPLSSFLTCDVDVSYAGKSGITENYQQTFHLAPGHAFVDDFSTRTRQHVFSAVATRKGGSIEVEIRYFSDVSALDAIDVTGALSIDATQLFESSHGEQTFSTSNPGSYTTTWTLTCRR